VNRWPSYQSPLWSWLRGGSSVSWFCLFILLTTTVTTLLLLPELEESSSFNAAHQEQPPKPICSTCKILLDLASTRTPHPLSLVSVPLLLSFLPHPSSSAGSSMYQHKNHITNPLVFQFRRHHCLLLLASVTCTCTCTCTFAITRIAHHTSHCYSAAACIALLTLTLQ
jgi:hypothetical protein